jgi:Type VI secretion system effector, Hcp
MRYGRGEAPRERRLDEVGRDPAEAGAPRPEQRVLALQRSAGNRAVSAMLARAPETAVPADAKDTAGPTATLSGIGTIPLLSVGLDPAGGPPDREGEAKLPKDILLTSKLGKHSALLSKASADGTSMDVEIVMPRGGGALRIKLTGAVVSSYSASGETESWQLSFSSIKFEHVGEQEEPDGGRRSPWDDTRGRG